MRILLVCDGNICRSPMAAAYMEHRVAREEISRIVVDSAGLLGIEGAPASPAACMILHEEGIDLSRHRSRGLRAADLESADLVLVMTSAQRAAIERRFAGLAPRIELLRAYESPPGPMREALDLDDPMGCEVETYRECFRVIRACVDHLVLSLRKDA